ncbi:MAG TPA: hypothetical protein VNH19_20835 [Candidatus Limnocylindrales bacterium]|nr:hypothetical protein [Candidatus Limnocylindrales bacterium]
MAGLSDGGVDAVVSVDEDIFAPDGEEDFLAGDEPVAVFSEQEKELQGNTFEFDQVTSPAELEGALVEFEIFKSYGFVGHGR